MDSINRNQPEDNREDLGGQEAVKRIQEMAEQAENCWFCSAASTAESNGDRPMNIRQVDDPRITVIKVTPSEGYYWDTKHGNAVAGVKMLIGTVLRKTLDDSVTGKLDV